MVETSMPPTREEFDKWVRDALNHLYDSPYLQKHPLADLLLPADTNGASYSSQNLRRILLDAIRAMRPASGVPAQSPDWRAYRILELRYIEVLSPKEVMQEIALGRSQYFQEQGRVLEALIERLWKEWQTLNREPASEPVKDESTPEDLVQSETQRLQDQATQETVAMTDLLSALQGVIAPLAKARNVTVQYNLPSRLHDLYVDRVMLRQAILNAITCALDLARNGFVDIEDYVADRQEGLRIVAHPLSAAAKQEETGLDVCRQLVKALGGTFSAVKETDHWEARLTWLVNVPNVLLVIDDNENLAVLFRRYLAGHNWQILGATSGAEAREIVLQTRPTVIVLDVMMPGEDGWELLMRLKEDEAIRDIPIIICSVLNEPRLALELGAALYLQKPVDQPTLVQTLSGWSRA